MSERGPISFGSNYPKIIQWYDTWIRWEYMCSFTLIQQPFALYRRLCGGVVGHLQFRLCHWYCRVDKKPSLLYDVSAVPQKRNINRKIASLQTSDSMHRETFFSGLGLSAINPTNPWLHSSDGNPWTAGICWQEERNVSPEHVTAVRINPFETGLLHYTEFCKWKPDRVSKWLSYFNLEPSDCFVVLLEQIHYQLCMLSVLLHLLIAVWWCSCCCMINV